MLEPYILYIISAIGAIGTAFLLPSARTSSKAGHYSLKCLGALLICAFIGLLWLSVFPFAQQGLEAMGMDKGAFLWQYIFGLMAIGSALRVITHTRPVYAALWFIMVVLSSAGLFLTLQAEFMAFAMIIIYGGAILVTYMFVLMMASPPQGKQDTSPDSQEYDKLSREKWIATMASFVLLASLLSVFFSHKLPDSNANAPKVTAELLEGTDELTNIQEVGLDLFINLPLSIELAGIVLLVSLVGSIVLARMKPVATPNSSDSTPSSSSQ